MLSTLTAYPARAETIERIVAVVNDDVILFSELEHEARPQLLHARLQGSSLTLTQVLDTMIEDRLIAEQARLMKLRVDQAEVQRTIERMASQNKRSVPELYEEIEISGLTPAWYETFIERYLLRMSVVRTKIAGHLDVSEAALRAAYWRRVEAARLNDRCQLARLIVTVEPGAAEPLVAARTKLAASLQHRAASGVSLTALAQQQAGAGVLVERDAEEWLAPTTLSKQLRQVVVALDTNELGGPVRTQRGLEIIKVIAWETADIRPYEQARESLREEILQQRLETFERNLLRDLRRRAHVEVRL